MLRERRVWAGLAMRRSFSSRSNSRPPFFSTQTGRPPFRLYSKFQTLQRVSPVADSTEDTSMAVDGKTPLSAAEQARLRRERREKKILRQGTNRLEKIAGLQAEATTREAIASPPPHPDPPEYDISVDLSPAETSVSPSGLVTSPDTTRHAVSPGRNIFAVDGGDEEPFKMLRGGNDPMANMPEELWNDPMMKLLKNPLFEHLARAGSGAAGRDGPSQDSSSDDLNRLAERLNQQLFGSGSGLQSPNGIGGRMGEVMSPDALVWKWKLARVVGVVTVLYCLWTQIEDIHFSRTMQMSHSLSSPFRYRRYVLFSTRVVQFLDHGPPPSDPYSLIPLERHYSLLLVIA